MKGFLATAVLLSVVSPTMAGEAWQPVYEDGHISVAMDAASLSRDKQTVVFREREVMLKPEMDTAAMRRVQEIQYRRQADCGNRKLGVLSRTVFSEQGTLMNYEATKRGALSLAAPQSGREFKVLEAVCGPA